MSTPSLRYWPPLLDASLSWYATPSPPVSKLSAWMRVVPVAAIRHGLPPLPYVRLVVAGSNEATTDCAALSVTLQAPVPEQAPLQPANAEPDAGEACSVTTLPTA